MSTPFEFPPFYQLPPFFTIQQVVATRQRQVAMWGDLIRRYSQHFHLFELDLSRAHELPLFHNADISRQLSVEGIRMMLDALVASGHAFWEDAGKTRCLVSWRTAPEWAAAMMQWVDANALHGKVFTVYELACGDEARGQEFHGLDLRLLRSALQHLESQGQASIFRGSDPSADGVKFQ
eukprot:gnl/Trimastix_PCT/4337.p1 GENE.gnl/Trimastix_PCT/4337~~gnl/Trimastix_PCT/4337.p1  ORF type:complete len:179 (-),score=25.54 gnl/Trimastix_PCT/4337:33-569(-)